jgi:hypothetical protein
MKAIWAGQPKKYRLRWARIAKKGPLSGIVLFYEKEVFTGYIRVQFENSFVKGIGRHMPVGIGPEHPAYLILEHNEQYRVWCRYLKEEGEVLLWQQEEKPKWCKGVVQL